MPSMGGMPSMAGQAPWAKPADASSSAPMGAAPWASAGGAQTRVLPKFVSNLNIAKGPRKVLRKKGGDDTPPAVAAGEDKPAPGAAGTKLSYEEVNGPVPRGPTFDADGLAQQTAGHF